MANSLNIDITDKVVVIAEQHMAEGYENLANRLFKAEGGFGCDPQTMGNAVVGTYLVDGEKARREGWQIERLADEEDLACLPPKS